MDSTKLINFFRDNNIQFKITVQGKKEDLEKEGFNENHPFAYFLDEDDDKHGVQYRIDFKGQLPDEFKDLTPESNKNRINNNKLIKDMLSKGCHLGNN